jgi:DNA-binding beta-propeller fold protein YncE
MKKLLVLLFAFAVNAQTPHYHVVRHIPVGGEGGWDYLTADSRSNRLYLSHSDRVDVVDTKSGKVVGTIPNTQGVHGIALAPDLHRGFISAGKTSTVTIFDLETLKTIGEVKTTGDRPDAILYEPNSKLVLTFNAGGKNATVIDAATGTVRGTIPLGGKPEFAVSNNLGYVFVNIEDTSEMVALEPKALKVLRRWSLAPCVEPSGLAFDQRNQQLFSVCDNKTMAISKWPDAKVIGTVPIGEGVDGAAFDPKYGTAMSANGADGTITVVLAHDKKVLETVPTQKGARTIALDALSHHLFLPTAQFGPPPAPTTERPHPRPSIVPGTFEVLEVAP